MPRARSDPGPGRWIGPGYLVAGAGIGCAVTALIGWAGVGPLAWGFALAIGSILVVLGSSGFVWGRARTPEPVAGPTPGATPPRPATVDAPAIRVPPVPPSPAADTETPTPRRSTSIPGAYLAALGPSLDPEPGDVGPDPPPIAAALPFAAMARPPPYPSESTETDDGSPILDVELARLRARVRELDLGRPGADAATPAYAVSGGTFELPSSRDRSDGRPVPSVGRFPTDPTPGPPGRRSPIRPPGSESLDPSG